MYVKTPLPRRARQRPQRRRDGEGVAIFASHQRLIETLPLYIHPERSDVCKQPPPSQDAPASAAGEGWGGGSGVCCIKR